MEDAIHYGQFMSHVFTFAHFTGFIILYFFFILFFYMVMLNVFTYIDIHGYTTNKWLVNILVMN